MLGLQFESFVINNYQAIIACMGVRLEHVRFANPYFQRKQTRYAGCQIDYLIQTRESIYACEVRFSKNRIGLGVVDEMKDKLKKLRAPKYVSRRAVLIHVNGVQNSVVESGFFSSIIDFSELLEGC